VEATRFLTCERCAERIGTYEPLWWQRPDGTLAASSFLHVREDPRREQAGSAFFHEECMQPAETT
jgi:hypothetical protein